MELSVSDLLSEITKNWEKAKLLFEVSERYADSPVEITIYESCIVLISANLESGTKRIIKYWIDDYSENIGVLNANKKIMQTLADSFFNDEKKNYGKERIKDIFRRHSLPIESDCFVQILKNPKPKTFKKFFEKVGEDSFYKNIENQIFEDIFSPNSDEREQTLTMIKDKIALLKSESVDFVEELIPENVSDSRVNNNWTPFLDQLMQERNRVAHGNDEQVSLTKRSVRDFIEKAEIFQYLIVLSLYQILFDDYKKSMKNLLNN